MKAPIDTRDASNDPCPERELSEERFLEQFAALEESLTLLQAQMDSMSASAKSFGSMVRRIRRSTCPTTGHQDKNRAECGLDRVDDVSDHRK